MTGGKTEPEEDSLHTDPVQYRQEVQKECKDGHCKEDGIFEEDQKTESKEEILCQSQGIQKSQRQGAYIQMVESKNSQDRIGNALHGGLYTFHAVSAGSISGRYAKDHLKTPEGTFYLGKVSVERY